jgi:hypothetical protein
VGTQSELAQAPGHCEIGATQKLREARWVERLVQAQQLVLLARPPPATARRRQSRRRADPDPRRAPPDRLSGAVQALGDVLQSVAPRDQPHHAPVVVGAPAARIRD